MGKIAGPSTRKGATGRSSNHREHSAQSVKTRRTMKKKNLTSGGILLGGVEQNFANVARAVLFTR